MSTPRPSFLTIDFLASVLKPQFLVVGFLSALFSRTGLSAWDQPFLSISFYLFGIFVLYTAPQWLNQRIAFGKARPVSKDEESVVVVTGGSSGLGRTMVEMYANAGVTVAVLDVAPYYAEGEEEEGSDIHWYRCDVGEETDVKSARNAIENDLGTPSVLINNAGIVNGKPLLSLSAQALERNFRINLLSHYFTIQAFLPGMLARPGGGTIVTVSSVLGQLGASHLSDYTAAKAGLIAMHASLNAELSALSGESEPQPGANNIRTILVKPGQLTTPLFEGVKTPSTFFGRVVEPPELASQIIDMVRGGESGVIAEPLYARWIEFLGILPYGLQGVARMLSGVDNAMAGFGDSRAG